MTRMLGVAAVTALALSVLGCSAERTSTTRVQTDDASPTSSDATLETPVEPDPTGAVSVPDAATTDEPPFPLPPGAPREAWSTPDGLTFVEEIAAADMSLYCAVLQRRGYLAALPDDVAEIFAARFEEPEPVCFGESDGWLIVVAPESADVGSVVTFTIGSLHETG